MKMTKVAFCLLLELVLLGQPLVLADPTVEAFNGYGVAGALNTKGAAGNGWLTGWGGSVLPKYDPGSRLGYSAPWFSDLGPDQDAVNYGLAHSGQPGAYHLPNPDGVDPNSVAVRSISGLTGTVWISALTILTTGFPVIGDGQGTILWLEPNASGVGGDNYIAIRGDFGSSTGMPEASIKYGGISDNSNNSAISRGPTKLLVARIEIDINGTPNDRLTFWVDPVMTGQVADLEPQAIYTKSGADVFGSSFDSIGISFAAGLNMIDSIRISAFPEGVGVNVPEPPSVLLGAVAFASLFARRRKSVHHNRG